MEWELLGGIAPQLLWPRRISDRSEGFLVPDVVNYPQAVTTRRYGEAILTSLAEPTSAYFTLPNR
jgi:hypothetical protein